MKKKCRIVSQQFGADSWEDFEIDGIEYSGRTPLSEADALVAL